MTKKLKIKTKEKKYKVRKILNKKNKIRKEILDKLKRI